MNRFVSSCCIFLLFAMCFPLTQRAQTHEADSLKRHLLTILPSHSPTDTVIITCLNDIAYSMRNNVHDSALVYAQEAYRRAVQANFALGQANALLTQGIVAIYEGHYNAALDLNLQAIDLYKQLGNKLREGSVLNNIGYLYKAQGKLAIAKEYFLRSEALFREVQSQDGLALAWGNLGDIALKEGDLAAAMHIEQNALRSALTVNDRYYEGVALYHIGTVFLAMQQYDSARAYQQRALTMFLGDGNNTYTIRSYENLAAIAAAEGRFDVAFEAAKQGFSIAERFNLSVETVLICERLSSLYERTGNFALALAYYRSTSTLRDSLTVLNIEQRMKVLDMMRLAEKTDKNLLKAENEQNRLQWQRNSVIAGFGAVVILLVLALNRYRFKSRAEKEQRAFNETIVRQQAQLQEQAARIQSANTELAEINAQLDHQNEHLQRSNHGLEEANTRLATLNHEKDELLGIVAHDLKNPLTGIMLAASSLRNESERVNYIAAERANTLTSRILASSERMMNIITKLLRSNLLDEGAVQLNVQRFDIATLTREIAEEHLSHAQSKSIALHIDVPSSGIIAHADPDATAEIIENLLDNALKYSPHGKNVWIRIISELGNMKQQKVFSSLSPQNSFTLRLEIQDEGPGLSDADKTQLFRKFTRLSAQPTSGEQSTGLGLSIVKKLVEGMNGRVWCESETGNGLSTGATFIVELPAG